MFQPFLQLCGDAVAGEDVPLVEPDTQAVRRNLYRFPADFMFQLTLDEADACAPSRFQFGTLKRGQKINIKEASLPYRVNRK